jgi:hypothetical protein
LQSNGQSVRNPPTGSQSPIRHDEAAAKINKLRAMTVERGASPAEAATAASLARRLISQVARRAESDRRRDTGRGGVLAPGVHVDVVSRRRVRAAGC